MAELVVEVRDSHHRIQGFYPLRALPASIGRGYDNDIILDDPHVCARHLVIDGDESGWQVRDDDSVNGVQGNDGERADYHVSSGDEIVIGRTHLRFFAPDHPVDAARRLHDRSNILDGLLVMGGILGLLSVMMLVFAFNDYLTIEREVQVEKLIVGTLPVVVAVLIWAGGWSLLAYIVRRHLYFYYFLSISVVYVLLDLILEILIRLVAFNIINSWIIEALSYFTGGILLVGLFYASMRQAFVISTRRALSLANIFSWGLVAVFVFVAYANRAEFSRNPDYPAELKPPMVRVVPLQSFDRFMQNTESMLDEFKQ